MTRIEYELFCDNHPELGMPRYSSLWQDDLKRLENHTKESLVAARTAQILSGASVPELSRRARINCFPQ